MTVPAESRGGFPVTEVPVRWVQSIELAGRTGGEKSFADDGTITISYKHTPGLQVLTRRPYHNQAQDRLSSLTLPDGTTFNFDFNDYCFLKPDSVTFIITKRKGQQSPNSAVRVEISKEGFSYSVFSV